MIIDFICKVTINFVAGSTNWKSLSDVKAEKLGTEKADFFTSKATIVFSKKENALYMVIESTE